MEIANLIDEQTTPKSNWCSAYICKSLEENLGKNIKLCPQYVCLFNNADLFTI